MIEFISLEAYQLRFLSCDAETKKDSLRTVYSNSLVNNGDYNTAALLTLRTFVCLLFTQEIDQESIKRTDKESDQQARLIMALVLLES